jgi:EAL and modified HD-GYP domain-containing signal transduction protein
MNSHAMLKADAPATAFIGRQPIFDRAQGISGYELLFRSSEENAAAIVDGSRATMQVIYNSLIEIGLDALVGNGRAFINVPRALLNNGITELLPPGRIAIEILESETADDELVECVRRLTGLGYIVALDDFSWHDSWRPLLPHVSIIKLDVRGKSLDQIRRELEQLQPYAVEMLAEKVETQEEFNSFLHLPFRYFQGYFFAKPSVIRKEKIPENQLGLLQLLARLQDPDIGVREVQDLISRTVALNYKLFRYINSAFFGVAKKIDSLQRAVVYFGLKRVKQLASLIVMTDVEDKPPELILTALTRAKMCELLARTARQPAPDTFFVVGLFSVLDALLDMPMAKVIEQMPLVPEVSEALLDGSGVLGAALSCAVACDECRWEDIRFAGLPEPAIHKLHCEAMGWSRANAPAGI